MIEIKKADCMGIYGIDSLPAGSIDLVLTDPPYGVTVNEWDSDINIKLLFDKLTRVLKPKGMIVMTAKDPFAYKLKSDMSKIYKYELIWDKGQGTNYLNAKNMPLASHENILIFTLSTITQSTYNPIKTPGKKYKTKQGGPSSNYGTINPEIITEASDRYPVSILYFPRDKSKSHPTQKPLSLMEYLIKTYSNVGETILDPFAGSGTTGVAAKRLGRNAIMYELSDEYLALTRRRCDHAQFIKERTFDQITLE